MAKITARTQDVMNTTQRHLEEMQLRVAEHDVPGGPADRELTEMKQRQIVERASAILFEKGFHGTSIRDIAAACDMSMGQLYHYISSKDDILFLMHLYSQEQWYRHLADARLRADHRPGGQARARRAHLHPAPLGEPRPLPVHLHREQVHGPGASAEGSRARRPERRRLLPAPALGAARPESRLAGSDLAASIVAFSARSWPCGLELDLHDQAAVDAAVESLVDFIFRGLGIERGYEQDFEEAAHVDDP